MWHYLTLSRSHSHWVVDPTFESRLSKSTSCALALVTPLSVHTRVWRYSLRCKPLFEMLFFSLFCCGRGLNLGLELPRQFYTMRCDGFLGMTQPGRVGGGFAELKNSVIDSLWKSQRGGTFSSNPVPRRTWKWCSWGSIQEFVGRVQWPRPFHMDIFGSENTQEPECVIDPEDLAADLLVPCCPQVTASPWNFTEGTLKSLKQTKKETYNNKTNKQTSMMFALEEKFLVDNVCHIFLI